MLIVSPVSSAVYLLVSTQPSVLPFILEIAPAKEPLKDTRTVYSSKAHTTCHASVVATGMEGDAPGELWSQCVHEETHQIFVAKYFNHRVEIFSETGEFISQLGVRLLFLPHGVAIQRDSLYVCCWGDHTVRQFSLIEMCHVRWIGGEGSNNGQFNRPGQVTTDLIGRVFIADSSNDRICIHDLLL